MSTPFENLKKRNKDYTVGVYKYGVIFYIYI